MSEITEVLQRELQRLEAELAQDVRYRRIVRIRELLLDYQGEAQRAEQDRSRQHSPSPSPPPSGGHFGEASKADLIKAYIKEYLEAKGRPVHRNELLEQLMAKNLMGHEKRPMASLAAYLSDFRSELGIEPDGKGHWRFKRIEAPTANASEPHEFRLEAEQTGAD
jgi:hypothetical protein